MVRFTNQVLFASVPSVPMMRDRFRVTAAALALVSAACGGGDTTDGPEPPAADPVVAAASTPAADATAGDGGVADQPASDESDESGSSAEAPGFDVVTVEPEPVEPVVFPLTINDAAGREFTFDEPAKLGCVWVGCTEIHASLGVAPKAAPVPAGIDDDSVFYFPVGQPDFVPTVLNDFEAWAGADIDTIILRGLPGANDGVVEQFVDIFYLYMEGVTDENVTGVDVYRENLRLVGQIIGEPEAAAEATARLDTAISTLAAFSTPELAERSFAYVFNEDAYRVMTSEAPFCAAIAEAGLGTCIERSEGELNAEELLRLDPDVIAYQQGLNDVATRDDPTWGRLSAVQDGTAYDSDDGAYRCCVSRSLIWALQDFAASAIPDSPIPPPGPLATFDPTTSPLVIGD